MVEVTEDVSSKKRRLLISADRDQSIKQSTRHAHKKVIAEDPEASLYCTADAVILNFQPPTTISNFRQQVALTLWESIQGKIVRTPFENVLSLKPEIMNILTTISMAPIDNLASLQKFVGIYLKKVNTFNKLQSSYSTQLSLTSKYHQLGEKTSYMKEALLLISQLREEDNVIQEQAAQLSLEMEELEARLQSIKAESNRLLSLSCEKREAIQVKELEVVKVQKEIDAIENTPTLDDKDAKTLATLREIMEAEREELKYFKWKP